jgi:hypothetical protein
MSPKIHALFDEAKRRGPVGLQVVPRLPPVNAVSPPQPREEARTTARPDLSEKSGVVGQWWFWAGLGAVVAGATVGGYLVFRPRIVPIPPSNLGTWDLQ